MKHTAEELEFIIASQKAKDVEAILNNDGLLVPKKVTKVQAMKAMKEINIWSEFLELLDSNIDAKEEWDLTTYLHREHAFVNGLAPYLNLSQEQLDQIFIIAWSK
jgi:hypothetical protein